MTLSEAIKSKRTELGYSQKALGRVCGISRYAVNYYECRRQIPTFNIALRLAKALDISLDDLSEDMKAIKPIQNNDLPKGMI